MVFFSNLLWEASLILRSKYKKIRLHIYCLGRVYLYILIYVRIPPCDILVALVSTFIKFYKFVWQVFLFRFSLLVMQCVVLIGVIVWILVQ